MTKTTQEKIAEAQAELSKLGEEAREVASDETTSTSTALVAVGSSADAAKKQMALARASAVKMQAKIEKKQQELKRLLDLQMEEAKREMQKALQVLEPLQEQVKTLEEGIWTVNLYLGREEELLLLRDGEAAPAEMPVTLRQMVLAMDEECATAVIGDDTELDIDDEGGVSAVSIGQFDKWLLSHPDHLRQVLPEEKGVVALMPRFPEKERYKRGYRGEQKDAGEQSYFLIRNGERVYRTTTNFEVGKRLVPAREEFTQFFMDRGKPIKPNTHAWVEAEKRSDAQRRHYMRVALILQGLIDRTTVFYPLPEEGISFLEDYSYESGRIRFVNDAEMALETGRPRFKEWQEGLNKQLRKGLRVTIANFGWRSGLNGHDYEGDRYMRGGNHRLHPPSAPKPKEGEIYALEEKKGNGFVFRYNPGDEVYEGWYGSHERKRRVSCTIYPEDSWVLAYDLASLDDIFYYLRSRSNREDYLDMLPALKSIIKAKRQEAEMEQPFRTMMVGVLARESGQTVEDARLAVDELVDWWKLANRHHRPLVGSEDENAKAVNTIVREYKKRLAADRKQDDPALIEHLRRHHPNALLIGRKRTGEYVVFDAMNQYNVFVKETTYKADGMKKDEAEWKLTGSRVAKFKIVHESERWEEWDVSASLSEHLTDPEIVANAKRIEDGYLHRPEPLLAVTYNPEKREYQTYIQDEAFNADEADLDNRLTEPSIQITTRGWRRDQSRKVILEADRWRKDNVTWPRWRSSFSDDPKLTEEQRWAPPWEGKPYILFENLEALQQVRIEREQYKEADRRQDAYRDRWVAFSRSIEEQWVAEAEKKVYAKFLEDYADPDLWEGHRKMLAQSRKLPSWPHDKLSGSVYTSPIDALARGLVKRDVDLNGMTVREAVELAKAHDISVTVPADTLDFVFRDPRTDLAEYEDEKARNSEV
jgi:hypothetical protein